MTTMIVMNIISIPLPPPCQKKKRKNERGEKNTYNSRRLDGAILNINQSIDFLQY